MWTLGFYLFVSRRVLNASAFAANNHGPSNSRLWGNVRKATRGGELHSSTLADAVKSESKVSTVTADHGDFVRPDPDLRKYRSIRLANNLDVLLVSSPESDTESGAVHVKAGHMDDPADRPGLAHFHEHMLFLGTEKYPSEDEYEAFLSSHGGSANAYTDMEDTNYYFSITPLQENDDEEGGEMEAAPDKASAALTGSLDRLAQFFIAPKFDVGMVERELRAIDSEYRNSFTSDGWRNYSLLKGSANPEHPFAKFGCGNYNTLTNGGKIVDDSTTEGGTSPRGELVEFWETYYGAHNVKLCVVGRASLDGLQKAVEDTFGGLAHSNGKPRLITGVEGKMFPLEDAQYGGIPAFGKEQVRKIREIVPLMETRAMKVHFVTPPLNDPTLKSSRPYRVLSHLLGHESPGSLYEVLNEEGLLSGLSSGVGIDNSDFSLFSLTLSLTKKGMKEKARVLDLIFQYMALITKTPHDVLEKYHNELCQISEMNFKFRENGDSTDFCSSASELMFEYNPADILVGSSRCGEYDPKVCDAFMARLSPRNVMITELNSDLEVKEEEDWQTEKWYGATYREIEISDELTEKWTSPAEIDPRLQLPALNEYIPTDFSLRCEDTEELKKAEEHGEKEGTNAPPKLLVERPNLRFWHKLDRTWKVPKTSIKVSLTSPEVYHSPRSMTLNRLFQKVLNDDLTSFVYDASVAGCNYRVSCVPSGYRLSVSGYSEKLPFLLDTLTSRMLSLIEEMKEGPEKHPALADSFNKAHDNLLRQTKNYRFDSPYEIANYNSRLIIDEDVWYADDYIAEMEGEGSKKHPLTMEECARAAEEGFFGRLKAEVLCSGNIDEAGAREVVEVIDNHFLKPSRTLLEAEAPSFRSMKLPTSDEAVAIFGPDVASKKIPLIYQEVASSDSEENNAVEITLQAGCDFEFGYEGVAILELISHMAYTSAYSQLRTKEQLGYIVSAFARKNTGGAWGLSIIVQSSTSLPVVLEERCEAWLSLFRKELEQMEAEEIAMEAGAVVAQLLERDTKLSQEISRMWGAILVTESYGVQMKEPAFDRIQKLSEELLTTDTDESEEGGVSSSIGNVQHQTALELKAKVLSFFDEHFVADAPKRRAMVSRIYNQKSKSVHDESVGKPGILSNYEDIRNVKQYFSSWPKVPFYLADNKR